MQLTISCSHYQSDECRSCQWLERPYVQQIEAKQADLHQLLAPFNSPQVQWEAPYLSPLSHFRNKAKMAVSGTVERCRLGILRDPEDPQSAVDLTDCPLYPARFASVFLQLKDFIARAGLVPYNVAKQKGELKYVLLSESQINGALMLRFVLRSEQKLPLIRRELAGLLAKLPQLSVVSVNIQPQHAAILEGEKEIFLTEQRQLEEQFNRIPLFIRPQGFFQTNPTVASALYAAAQTWVKALPVSHLWDLFCGVGGFGLHCATALKEKTPELKLTGIEISPSAITSATLSAEKLGLASQIEFRSLDAAQFALAQDQRPDLVIVNPPRRGIGRELAQFLQKLAPHFILYSSCNAQSMAQDLHELTGYQLQKVQLFDMFPHTSHYETMILLSKFDIDNHISVKIEQDDLGVY